MRGRHADRKATMGQEKTYRALAKASISATEWTKKISAMHLFDGGWNKLRETIFTNQKRLGVLPPDAKLTPWPNDLLKEWDQLTPDEKKLFIRQVDVFAASWAYSDHEIGRVIQAIDEHGEARQHADHLCRR